ncbi:MAG TPA: FAD-dependent oxidoreductase [Gemmatimonadales bacterium]|jgi:glycine/D-amino acid oxidase-like deaminating enzyme
MTADVIVVGAGLVGTMTTLCLTEAGADVTLLEASFPGGGSSGAAMGHVVVMDDTPAQFALCNYSRARWQDLSDSLPAAAEYDGCGTLWIAADDRELEGATERATQYWAAGVAAEIVDAQALRELEPQLRPDLAGALLVPGDGVCYPPAVARAISARAASLGARVQLGSVVQSIESNAVRLQDGTTLHAGAIVIAAGVASTYLVPGLPIVPRKGHLVISDRTPGFVRHQLVELGYLRSAHTFGGSSVAFNVQPRRNGQVLIGSSRELVGTDSSINRSLVATMLARATEYMPGVAELRALRTWIGFRPATPDKLPLIGPWPQLPGAWIAAGHEGLGITMATGTAELIVAGITGKPAPIDPLPYRPDRTMPSMGHLAA